MCNGSNEERPVQKMGNKVWHTVMGLLSVVACMLLLLHETLFTDKFPCKNFSYVCTNYANLSISGIPNRSHKCVYESQYTCT